MAFESVVVTAASFAALSVSDLLNPNHICASEVARSLAHVYLCCHHAKQRPNNREYNSKGKSKLFLVLRSTSQTHGAWKTINIVNAPD